ncbi:DUF6173 family protein [Pseudosulfitobacter koreensis]|uniref:DUF6173 family protein n=1 Tax=Pseudosulfitobacter koreensis TaxID=2968472 RepID=A0ABT1YYZ2_9RHOB|nr:DUF6173 family protein [Pseudosulfitobacter koreense]MCR8826090.1 DUF6173 family protein [Pseudosulfitobacter koreense]
MDDDIRTTAEAIEADVMPRLYEVHCDPKATNANDQPLPKGMQAKPQGKKSPAQWAYERLALYIKNFEEKLDNEHEVAMGFAGGDAGVLRIEGMGYFDPDVITFYGSDPTGARTQLIQHVTQLNVMLRAVPKAVEQAAPNRIGFRLAEALDDTPEEA